MKSFREFLEEGMIKVPHSTLSDIHNDLIGIVVAVLDSEAEDNLSTKEYSTFRNFIRKFDVFEPDFPLDRILKSWKTKSKLSKKYKIVGSELPKSYVKNNKEHDFDILVNYVFVDNAEHKGEYDPKTNSIELNLGYFTKHTNSLIEIESAINEINIVKTTAEHELIHAVQEKYLKNNHEKQTDIDMSLSREDAKKIENIPKDFVEYYPWIKTEMGTFNKLTKDMSVSEKKAYVYSYTLRISPWFKSLKTHSELLYQKAVKVFYKELNL